MGGLHSYGGAATSVGGAGHDEGELKVSYKISQNIIVHSMIRMNKALKCVGSGCGQPITYFDFNKKAVVEGVPNIIVQDAQKTIMNILKKPQNNNIEKVSDWELYIDEYHICEDTLLVLDYLDPIWQYEPKEGTNDYEKYRHKRMMTIGIDIETKFYALTNAVDVKCYNRTAQFTTVPEGFSEEKLKKYFDYYMSEWTKVKMEYVLKNFYDFQRANAVIHLFREISRMRWYYNMMKDDVIECRIPIFKYSKLTKLCQKHFYCVDDVMKKLGTSEKTYYGSSMESAVKQICYPYQDIGPDGKKLCDTMKLEAKAHGLESSKDDKASRDDDGDSDSSDWWDIDGDNKGETDIKDCKSVEDDETPPESSAIIPFTSISTGDDMNIGTGVDMTIERDYNDESGSTGKADSSASIGLSSVENVEESYSPVEQWGDWNFWEDSNTNQNTNTPNISGLPNYFV